MADLSIHALTDGVSLQTTDEVPVARSPYGASNNRKLLVSEFDARYGLGLHTVAASGSTLTVDISTANVWDITLNSACTFTLAGFTAGLAQYLTVVLRQDSSGSRTVTWPTINWIGAGIAPTLQTAANAVDSVVLFSFDGGTTVFGVAQTSTSGLASGTSFPGSPADGNLFYRTDRRILYEYDNTSTHWLSVDRKYVTFDVGTIFQNDATTPNGTTGYAPIFEDIYIESFKCTTRVSSNNDGSKFWTVALLKSDTSAVGTTVSSFNTSADTILLYVPHSGSGLPVVLSAATYPVIQVTVTKTSTPGDLICVPAMVVRSVG